MEAGKVYFRGGVDVASRTQCTQFMDEVIKVSGRLDGLLNKYGSPNLP